MACAELWGFRHGRSGGWRTMCSKERLIAPIGTGAFLEKKCGPYRGCTWKLINNEPGLRADLGATGFGGRRLIPELGEEKRAAAASRAQARWTVEPLDRTPTSRSAGGDVVENTGLVEALRGVETAYYLVHSMGGKTMTRNEEYADKDRTAARTS